MILKRNTNVIFTDSDLKIGNNTFEYEDSIIQVSNISQIYATERNTPYPFWIKYITFLCIILFILGFVPELEWIRLSFPVYIVPFLQAIIYARDIYEENRKFKYCVVINLNSGINVYFICKSMDYAKIVLTKIKDCMSSGTSYVFKFKEQIFDKNIMPDYAAVYGNIGFNLNKKELLVDIDWNKWDKAMEQSLKKIDENSSYYFIAKEAEMYVEDRDKEGLGKLIKKYGVDFAKNVLVGIAANEARNLISMFLK